VCCNRRLINFAAKSLSIFLNGLTGRELVRAALISFDLFAGCRHRSAKDFRLSNFRLP
jgi:hypothetical protein